MRFPTNQLASLLLLALILASCAPIRVRSDAVTGARLGDRTYGWASAEAHSTGDPRLDNNVFFHEHVRAAIERELEGRGFAKTADPTLRLHYYVSVSEEITNGTSQPAFEYGGGRPDIHEKGTLVIDLNDAATGRLVWRGWAEGDIDGLVNDQKRMEQRIDAAVARVIRQLDRLPVAPVDTWI